MADDSSRRCPSGATPIAPYELILEPHVLVAQNGVPDTIARWQALADSFLTDQACAFHRNVEISSRYAWIYKALPRCLKWAGMAAIASHHVRLSGDVPMTSSGSVTSSSLSTSSAPSCSPISITSRVHSRVWSRLAPQRTSRCVGVRASWRTSRRSTSTRSPEECRTSFARARGRESLATTTAGAGSRQALCPTSAGSTQTCAVSTPACCASSTTHAATQRPRAYYQQSRHKARLTPSGSALSTDTGMRPPCPQCRPMRTNLADFTMVPASACRSCSETSIDLELAPGGHTRHRPCCGRRQWRSVGGHGEPRPGSRGSLVVRGLRRRLWSNRPSVARSWTRSAVRTRQLGLPAWPSPGATRIPSSPGRPRTTLRSSPSTPP